MRASPQAGERPALSNQAGRRHNYRRDNPQRRVLMEQLAKGKSVTEAAKIAGYSCSQAASNALRAMRGQLVRALVDNCWGPEEFDYDSESETPLLAEVVDGGKPQ